jgi:hypothetical protein
MFFYIGTDEVIVREGVKSLTSINEMALIKDSINKRIPWGVDFIS